MATNAAWSRLKERLRWIQIEATISKMQQEFKGRFCKVKRKYIKHPQVDYIRIILHLNMSFVLNYSLIIQVI